MLIIAYILTGISALLGLGVGALGYVLSNLLINGSGAFDTVAGLFILLVSLLYIAHPLVAVNLIKSGYWGWCYVCDLIFVAISIGLCVFLLDAIGTAARP